MDRFLDYHDTSFSQQILYVSLAEFEAMEKPNGVLDYFRWATVVLDHF